MRQFLHKLRVFIAVSYADMMEYRAEILLWEEQLYWQSHFLPLFFPGSARVWLNLILAMQRSRCLLFC